MKTIIAIALAVVASAEVSAAEFAPWNEQRIESRPDASQAQVEIGSFYRAGKPAQDDAPSVRQADVVIAPWYDQGRV